MGFCTVFFFKIFEVPIFSEEISIFHVLEVFFVPNFVPDLTPTSTPSMSVC